MTEFVTDLPAAVTRGKRGRPSLFTEAIQADLAANPGKYAVLQTGVKGRSRLSALRKQWKDFEFQAITTEHRQRANKKGETVTDDIVTIYVRKPVPAAEVADSSATETTEAPAPQAAKRTRKAPAAK